ncbi:hypothetical protein Tco_0858213 [Tanacetum coccineum]|uniref:Uncharacterized protein n=1 Tax=Tanacetum coccineum TaxID=301880 RepID=A0ABQ5B984_9ASTR
MLDIANAAQDFKMRNLGRPKHGQLGKRNTEMDKNRHEEGRKLDTVVGIIKESSINSNFTEKEQKDKLNAVKARLIYGEESGAKIRSHEESHYSESKTPTARTESRRRRGDRYSRSPSPHASVFKRLKKNRSLSPQPRPQKEGGVFIRLGRKEPATSARPSSRQRSPQARRTEVEARRRQQKVTPSHTTSQYSESEDSEWGHSKSKSRRQKSSTYEDDLYQPWT